MEPYQPRYDYTVTVISETRYGGGNMLTGVVEIWDLKLQRLYTTRSVSEWDARNLQTVARWICWEYEQQAVMEWIARQAATLAKEQQAERVKRRNARRSAEKAKKGQVLAGRMAKNNRRKAKAAK